MRRTISATSRWRSYRRRASPSRRTCVRKSAAPAAIATEYELNTGLAIVNRFQDLDPLAVPAVLVTGHAPFCWGKTVADAAHNAVIVEEVAHMAFMTVTINAQAQPVSDELRDKHFFRKHGAGAYYGQKTNA